VSDRRAVAPVLLLAVEVLRVSPGVGFALCKCDAQPTACTDAEMLWRWSMQTATLRYLLCHMYAYMYVHYLIAAAAASIVACCA
jgi:hypothetical protein